MTTALGTGRRPGWPTARSIAVVTGAAAVLATSVVVLTERSDHDGAARRKDPSGPVAATEPVRPPVAEAPPAAPPPTASPEPARAEAARHLAHLPSFAVVNTFGTQPSFDLPYLSVADPSVVEAGLEAGTMTMPRVVPDVSRQVPSLMRQPAIASLQPRRSLLQDLYVTMTSPPDTAEIARPWILSPDPAPVASRFVKGRPVATRAPDLEFDVNGRTSLGVYGGLTHPERGDPLNGTALSRNKDREAGVTLQYKFDSR